MSNKITVTGKTVTGFAAGRALRPSVYASDALALAAARRLASILSCRVEVA